MHRLKVSLLCLLSLSFARSVYSQTPADPQIESAGTASYQSNLSLTGGVTPGPGTYFNIRHMTGDGVGYKNGYSNLGTFIPFWANDNTMFAPDLRIMIGNNSQIGANAGLVGRRYVDNLDRIFGAAAYFDVDQSNFHNTYTQATFGLETLGQFWDARANVYYVPGTQDKFLSNGGALCVTGDPRFAGNSIVFTGQQAAMRETAMSGADGEFGMPLAQSLPWLRVYGGMYYYRGSQLPSVPVDTAVPGASHTDTYGFRGRAQAWVADDLKLGVQVTTDTIWGTNVNATAEFLFSGFKPTRYFPNFATRERMLNPWERNWRIAVNQYGIAQNTDVAAVNPTTGKPYFIEFIDNLKTTTPGGGDGSFEHPFHDFNHPNGIPGADIIVVDRGTSTAANPYLGTMKLFDNQLLLGQGGTMSPLPLSATNGNCSVTGNFTLPGIDGSGDYPWVSNPAGNAITLANNNEVSGFHIINSSGDGIFGTGINNANLHDLDITGNAGRGINLVNASGTAQFTNVNASNNGTGIFLSETNQNLIANFLGVTANNNTNFGIDVVGNGGSVTISAPGGNQPLEASGNGQTNLNIVMTNAGTFQGDIAGAKFNNSVNGSGISYSQSGGTGVLNLSMDQMNGNGIDGLDLISSNNAVTTVNIVNSQLKNNIRDGIHNEQTTGADLTLSVASTILNGNGRDGYFYTMSGLSNQVFDSLNNTFNGNGRSGMFGLMDDSSAAFTVTNTSATNSGKDGFALDATNNSVFTAAILNSNFSNSGASGINVKSQSASTVTIGLNGVTDTNNTQNGLAFLANSATFNLTALNTNFNNNTGNGFLGNVQNGGLANLTVDNGSSISGNGQNGVFVTTTTLGNINAVFNNTPINNNVNGSGILFNMDNSPNSSLTLTGTTSMNNNGANGLAIVASTNTVFTPVLNGTSVSGNGQDGINISVATGSTVGSAATPGTLTDVVSTGNAGSGLNVAVNGVGSTSTLLVDNLNAGNNTLSNAIVNVTGGGFLNLDTTNSNFSNSQTGSGVLANVTGIGSTAFLDLNTAAINGNAAAGISGTVNAPAPGVGQTGASLNVCLDNSSVSNNTLQGIAVTSTGAGATAAFGIGTLTAGSASNINNNGSEGVLANAIGGGTVNLRSIGSHFDFNGQTVASDGVRFGGNGGVIHSLFYGGSADSNSANGVELGPIPPNASTFGSDLTVSLGNGFSASNNAGYGLVVDGTGANSVNVIQDPNSAPIVLNNNGSGPENLNFVGANQVLLQLLGSFDNSAGDGVNLMFSNITTAIVAINGLGNGTIDNNAGNGIHVTMNNVQNTAVTVSGYSSISNNGLNGVLIDINGSSAANPTKAAIEIAGIPGGTLMDSNGQNGVHINLLNTALVDPFNSLPGVNLVSLTLTDNSSLNSCIPVAVVLPPGQGLTPTSALNINGLNVTNTGASGGTGGITVAGTDTTIVPGNGFITNNNVLNSQNGGGISVILNETVAPTVPIASGFTISGNSSVGNQGHGITFDITNAAAVNVATADDLHILNNTVTGNLNDGIHIALNDPTGSVSTANGMQISGNTVTGNGGNGVIIDLTTIGITGMQLSNDLVDGNTLEGLNLLLNASSITGVTSDNLTLSNNGQDGLRLLLTNTSAFNDAIFTGASIHDNGFDGVTVDATDGAASTFGLAGGSVQFNSSEIRDNGQAVVGADGMRLRLYGGSSGDVQFNSTFIGNTTPAATQQYGVDFILGSGAFPGGNLTASFTGSNVSGNNVNGVLGLINGTGAVGGSSATLSFNNTQVSNNNAAGIGLAVNNAGTLGTIISNGSLIDSNGTDGVHINATDAGTTAATFILNSTLSNNGQVTPPGGNGLTLNLDNDATGTLTVDTSVIGNTSPGGTQVNGLELNVNQTTIGSNTNLVANITNSFLSNNAVSGLAGHITGNNVGLNPTNGLTLTMDTDTVDSNGGNGIGFIVDNGALLRMSMSNSFVTGSGQNGVFLDTTGAFTLAAVDMSDSALNNNGTILFPGDGFNATVALGATLNVCAETTVGGLRPMSFSGNTGDGMDVLVSDVGSRSDIDLHSVIAGADQLNGLLGNGLNGVKAQVFDGGELNVRANTTHFDGNFGAGLLGTVNDTNGADTVGRFRIIGGTADGNLGDGFSLTATNTTIVPIGTATLTAQFQADDLGTGISAQNNGGFGLDFVASNTTPPGGGIVGNLLMTGGSTLLGNGAGTLNVDMNGADQAIIGLSGTFDGSTTGDGIHIDLQNITGLALVSLQGPGEVKNNAGNGINVSMTNVNQGGVFIGGFSDVSNNGLDGIKVTMNNVALGAVTIDAQTSLLPSNIMNVSNNGGNGVNVIVNNGSVIDNTAFNAILGSNLVTVIDYTAPDQPCPTPLPNPLLTTSAVNVSSALGITLTPTLAIQNLTLDGNASAANSTDSGIVLTVDTLARIVGTPTINHNTITNTGSNLSLSDGILVQILGNADVQSVDIVTNDVESNKGNGIRVVANQAATLASLNIFDNTVLNNTGVLGVSGNGIQLDLANAPVLATVTIDKNDVEGNSGDGFQMINPNTGATNLVVNFTHNSFIGNGSIVPASPTTTYPPGGMGIDVQLNNTNATNTTINILSDANGINTISNSASYGLFVEATNQSRYNLNVTGTGGQNLFDGNTDAGIGIVAGSFVNPNNSLDPSKFSVGNIRIDNVLVRNTKAGSHPSLPSYPFRGDGIGILTQQYAEVASFVIGDATVRNTLLTANAGDGLKINAIENSQFRETLPDGVTPVTPLGQATILLQNVDAIGNVGTAISHGVEIIRKDNALLSWDDPTVNPGAAFFVLGNPVSWQAITDGGSFIHMNDVVATDNQGNGLDVSDTNTQFPITRIDIRDTLLNGNSRFDHNQTNGMQFDVRADAILVVNASDTTASNNNLDGILVRTFNRATFGDVLTSVPLGDPTSASAITSTFNGMTISGNGSTNAQGGLNANSNGFEIQANGGLDPFNVSSQSVVAITMTGTATHARNLFDSNGGDDFKVTANRFSSNYFGLNKIDMRDTQFVHLGGDGIDVRTNDNSNSTLLLTNASIGFPTASSTQTGLSGNGINIQTENNSKMNMFVGDQTIASPDPLNAADVSIYGSQLNGILVKNNGSSTYADVIYDTASRFNGLRGYSGQMTENSLSLHAIDNSIFSDNSREGIAFIANAALQSGIFVQVNDTPSDSVPQFVGFYNPYHYLNLTTATKAGLILTNSTVSNNGGTTPYVNTSTNVNGLEIDVSTFSYVTADIRNNTFHGNTLDDIATASFQARTGGGLARGFNPDGTLMQAAQGATLLNTPNSGDDVPNAGTDRIFLEDTAQLDMRMLQNVGDQVSISSAGSNNPLMGTTNFTGFGPNPAFGGGAVVSDQSGAKFGLGGLQTSLFQVNGYHYDTVGTATSNNVFTGTNILPLDGVPVGAVQDPTNFPGPTTISPTFVVTVAVRNLEAAILNIDGIYTNPNANPTNIINPTAFTQVRVDDITTGVNGTGAEGVINYVGATGQFTLAGAGLPGIAAGDTFRVHLLDTNTFNQFGVAQDVEAAFAAGFQSHTIRLPPGSDPASTVPGTYFTTNPLAPYFDFPSASFPPN